MKIASLLVYYIFFQALFVILSFFSTPLLSEPTFYLHKAIAFQTSSIILVIFGYWIGQNATVKTKHKRNYYLIIDKYFGLVIVGSSLLGLFVVVWLVLRVYQVSFLAYLQMFLHLDPQILLRRDEILNTDEVSGVIKMLNVLPLSMFLLVKSLQTFLNFHKADYEHLKKLEVWTLLLLILKTFFSLDRLSILAIIVSYSYQFINKKQLFSFKAGISIIFFLFIGNMLSSNRLEGYNLFDFLILYFKSGLINFQLLMDTYDSYTLGFSTFLSPLRFVLDFFSIENITKPIQYKWYWNPAQYFTSYLFMDFQYLSLLIYPLIGFLLKFIDNKKNNKSFYYSAAYFLILFTICSFMVVPFIRGMEFWVAIIATYTIPKIFIKKDATLF
jgi:hypothetical protein